MRDSTDTAEPEPTGKDSFLDLLAADQPVPGGGAAAAHGAILALALLQKLLKVEYRRSLDVADQYPYWESQLQALEELYESLVELREDDAKVYTEMVEARARKDQSEVFARAVARAAEVPLGIAEHARDALSLVAGTGRACKKHLLADLLVICELLKAGIRGGLYIARANLPLCREESVKAELEQRIDTLFKESDAEYRMTRTLLERRSGMAS